MLAPKVLSLKPTKVLGINLGGEKVYKSLNKQYFNHSVSLLLPDTLHPPQSVEEIFSNDTEYYHVHNIPICELVDWQFINLFIKTGSLTLLSVDKRIDQDDNIAILPNGVLILLLTSESFQGLGLEGKRSDSVSGRFVIKIDLKSQDLSVKSKEYLRIVKRLQSAPHLKFNVILSWEPRDKTVCPSSIAAWFCKASYLVNTCTNQFNRTTTYNVATPNFEDNDLSEILEWVGMILLQCDMHPSYQALSSYLTPEPNTSIGQIVSLQWTGLLTTEKINKATRSLQEWVNNRGSEFWIAMVVHGFEDSIMSLGEREHTYCLDGGYNISIFLRPNKEPSAFHYISPAGSCKNRKRPLIE